MRLAPFDGHATDVPSLMTLVALIQGQCPDVVVEAGTYRAHGAVFMGHALRDNKRGHLWTADPYDYGQPHILTENELDPWVTFQQRDFLEMLAEIPAVDFAFIDASEPPPDGAKLRWIHFQAVMEKLNPGGIIVVHDTAADDWSDGEGGASVKRIRDACQINFRFQRGLSIYYV